MNHTEEGALGGGVIGAGAGALVGNALCHRGGAAAGALIGGALGATTGAVAGSNQDEKEHDRELRLAQATAVQPPALGLQEIANMATQGVSDTVIIEQIRSSHSVYQLTPDQIVYLKQYKVSDTVIYEMQRTAHVPRRVYVAEPAPVVYVEEPRPVVGVGVGFGWRH
jgi:hypothetical protein